MNNNILLLKKSTKASNKFADKITLEKIYTVLLLIVSIINISITIKSNNLSSLTPDELSLYFSERIFIYFINISFSFVMICSFSILEIANYVPMFYLPISSNEFFLFLNSLRIKKVFFLSLINLLTFFISIISLNLSITIFFKILWIFVALTLLAYLFINVIVSSVHIILPSPIFKILSHTFMLSSGVITVVSNLSYTKSLISYFSKYIISFKFDINLIIFSTASALILLVMFYINKSLIKHVFMKAITSLQNSSKVTRNILIDKIKVSSPFYAYLKNEILLLGSGRYNYWSSFPLLIVMMFTTWTIAKTFSELSFIPPNSLICIIICGIILISDINIASYTLESIYHLYASPKAKIDNYLTWTDFICLDSNIYFYAKLIVKGFLTSINYWLLIASLAISLNYYGIKTNIIFYSAVLYLNIWIIAYFNNNIDFNHNLLGETNAIKQLLFTIKRMSLILASRALTIIIPVLLLRYAVSNIAVAILFSYILLFITIYFGSETVKISTAVNTPSKKATT